MAIEAVLEAHLPRTAEDVFAALADIRTWPEWLVASGVVGVRTADGGPLAQGVPVEIEQRLAGRASVMRGRVVAYEPARLLAVEGKDREGIAVVLDAQLAPDGPTCHLRWAVRLTLPLKLRFFESMVAPQVRQAAAADLERLRVRLSAVAG